MKTLRVGIIGTNFIQDMFCEAAELVPEVEVVAVYSRKFDTGTAFAQKHGINDVFTTLDDMILSTNVDAVYVASPTLMHAEHAVRALNAGKHVICEKACAVTYDEFRMMRKTADESALVLLEAMRPAFDPMIVTLRDNLSRIGKIRRFKLEFCKYSSRYDKFKVGIIENAFDPSLKNSALSDIGVYPLWLAVSLFGAECDYKSSSVFLENGFEASGEIILSYGDVVGTVSYSKITEGHSDSFIEGECGTLFIDKISVPSKITLIKNNGECELVASSDVKNNMIYEIEYFRDCVLGLKSAKPYLDQTDSVMRIIDGISREFFN